MPKAKKIVIISTAIFVCWMFFGIGSSSASAAGLYMSPASGSYNLGKTFSVAVYVSTPQEALNAISGTISFPQNKLELLSLSKGDTIINFWIEEPSYSNSTGIMNFEGIVLNPGFIGTGGKIISLSFKVKAVGSAEVRLTSGSVLANDGLGTNILTGMSGATFHLSDVITDSAMAAELLDTTRVPFEPQISSTTHPDQNKWYNNTNPKFSWPVPAGASGLRLLLSSSAQDAPSVNYSPPINYKELDEVSDGTWYLHARFKNNEGWGNIAHYKFQIDTKEPEFLKVTLEERIDLTEPQIKFNLEAEDETSGINHYEIQFNGGEWLAWQDDGSHKYQSEVLAPGEYVAAIKALDKAGNFLLKSIDFTIKPLDTPIITKYTKHLTTEDHLVIKGSTYPDSKVDIWLQKKGEEAINYYVVSDSTGEFIFISDKEMSSGTYKMWVEIIDTRGAKSLPTVKYSILVERENIFNFTSWPTDFKIALSLFIIILAILLLLFSSRKYRLRPYNKRFFEDMDTIKKELNGTIFLLKNDIQERVELLEKIKAKKELTKKELKIVRKLSLKQKKIKKRNKVKLPKKKIIKK